MHCAKLNISTIAAVQKAILLKINVLEIFQDLAS
jgi:hypothetical protein